MPLILLAGLPNPVHARGILVLQEILGANAKVIAAPSGVNDGALYSQRTIEELLRGAAGFAIRRLKTGAGNLSPTPKHIILFYVPAADDEQLLAAMDFFVFPVPLRELATYDLNGLQKRHVNAALKGAIEAAVAISRVAEVFIQNVKRRISNVRSDEPLVLPPANFHLADGVTLTKVFRELRRGIRAWTDPLPEMSAQSFDDNQLPDFLRKSERKDFYRDARSVVFPCARRTEFHALLRELENDSGRPEWRHVLRTAYRFGAPLPDGFHHDAQLEHGREFQKMPFVCSAEGKVSVTGPHANIYPNDFIRAKGKERV
jgi:hypothetical protein